MFLLQHFDCHTDLLMTLSYLVQARKNTCLHAYFFRLSHTSQLCKCTGPAYPLPGARRPVPVCPPRQQKELQSVSFFDLKDSPVRSW